jgi:hypothetical protein
MMRRCLLFAAALALSACAVPPQTTVTVATATSDVQSALTLYGVVKGIAQVAEVANPALAPAINAAIAALDPLAAQAQAALADATADAAALETLATAIRTQAAALTVQAAPAVKVVPGVGAVSAS